MAEFRAPFPLQRYLFNRGLVTSGNYKPLIDDIYFQPSAPSPDGNASGAGFSVTLSAPTATASGTSSAITEVGSGSQRAQTSVNGVDSTTLAYPANVTSGNLLVCLGRAFNGTAAPTAISVTDTRGTTYTVKLVAEGANDCQWIAYGIAPSSGANTVTVNPNNASDAFGFAIDEFTGVDTTTPLSVDGGTSTGTGTAVSDSLTTLNAGELVVGIMGHFGGTPTITPSNTQIGEQENNNTQEAFSAAFQIAGAAGSYSISWALGSSETWTATTLSFKKAGASPDGNATGAGFGITASSVTATGSGSANAAGTGFGITITGANGTASGGATGTGAGFSVSITGANGTASSTSTATAGGFGLTVTSATGSANSTANATGAGFTVTINGADGSATGTSGGADGFATGVGFTVSITGATASANTTANATGAGFNVTIASATGTASGSAQASGAGFGITITSATGSANSTANAQGSGFNVTIAGATGTATGTVAGDGNATGGGFGITITGANGTASGTGNQTIGFSGGFALPKKQRKKIRQYVETAIDSADTIGIPETAVESLENEIIRAVQARNFAEELYIAIYARDMVQMRLDELRQEIEDEDDLLLLS